MTPRIIVGLSWLAFGGTLFGIWCRTGGGVSLMGRPISPVEIERFGVDYKITGTGSFLLFGVGVGLAVVARNPRAGALVIAAAAGLTTFRLIVGDHKTYGTEQLSLRPGLALVLAAVLAWGAVGALALGGRH